MNTLIEKELHEWLERLPEEQQLQVLGFARALVAQRVRGCVGSELKRFGGAISKGDLAMIERALKEECEQVNPDEW